MPRFKEVPMDPSLVRLPDKRLFCVMRTISGYIWYSLSGDDGASWCVPRPLLRRDRGLPILEPLCCCPIYEFSEGRYVLLHHNNDGRFEGCQPEDTGRNRRPAFIALGQFQPKAEQPIWFGASKQLMDNDGKGIELSRSSGKSVPDDTYFALLYVITTAPGLAGMVTSRPNSINSRPIMLLSFDSSRLRTAYSAAASSPDSFSRDVLVSDCGRRNAWTIPCPISGLSNCHAIQTLSSVLYGVSG